MEGASEKAASVDATPSAEVAAELALVERMQAGDDAAYDTFVRQYSGRSLNQARRILDNEADAADAVQDAFLSFFKSIQSYKGQAQLGTWLHRIVINAALMKLRSQQRRPEQNVEDLLPDFHPDGHRVDPLPAWSENPEEMLQKAQTRRLLHIKISELPEGYRNVLIHRDIQDMSTEETAQALGESVTNVKTRLHRARQALRKLLEEELVR
jgi:RNA polymerase sigma-70 factor (ECF subfamily)